MRPVCTAAQCRAQDAACIDGLGIPGRQLMEMAGQAAAQAVHARWPGSPIAVLCGPGNNGGDGYVLARWLALWGHPVRLWASGPPRTPEAQANAQLCAKMGLTPLSSLDEALGPEAIAIDALLGTGQDQAPRGAIAAAVGALVERRPPVVALDLPTGVQADTGQLLGPLVVQAALTLSFGRLKCGHRAMPGAARCGEVQLIDIGLDLAQLVNPVHERPAAWELEAADIAAWLPGRKPGAAKWDRGHVAVMGGGGASVLAARGAFAAGAGLVSLLAPRSDWPALHGLPPEVILAEPGDLDPARHDVLVLGPGLGAAADAAVRALWDSFPGQIVADADALNALARRGAAAPFGRPGRSLTPHAAEAARLLGCSRAAVEANRFGAIARLGPGVLLKGPFTLIGGDPPWINPTGSAALATAGTGDVLAGLLGGLLAQGLPQDRAAAVACWLHGRAGERLAPNGTASDLLAALRLQVD